MSFLDPCIDHPSSKKPSACDRIRFCKAAHERCVRYRHVLLLVCETMQDIRRNIRDTADRLHDVTLPIGEFFKGLGNGQQQILQEMRTVFSSSSDIFESVFSNLRWPLADANHEADEIAQAYELLTGHISDLNWSVTEHKEAFKAQLDEHKLYLKQREGCVAESVGEPSSIMSTVQQAYDMIKPPEFLIGLLYRRYRTALKQQDTRIDDIFREYSCIVKVIQRRVMHTIQVVCAEFMNLHNKHYSIYTKLSQAFLASLDAEVEASEFIQRSCGVKLRHGERVDYLKHMKVEQFETARMHFNLGCLYLAKLTDVVSGHFGILTHFWDSVPKSLSRLDETFLEAICADPLARAMLDGVIAFQRIIARHAKSFNDVNRKCYATLQDLVEARLKFANGSENYATANSLMNFKVQEKMINFREAKISKAKAETEWKSCCQELDRCALISAEESPLSVNNLARKLGFRFKKSEVRLQERVIETAHERSMTITDESSVQNELQAMMEERNRSVRQRLVCMQVWEHERIGVIKSSFNQIFTIMASLNQEIVNDLKAISPGDNELLYSDAIAA